MKCQVYILFEIFFR